jgi:hypothetical protein
MNETNNIEEKNPFKNNHKKIILIQKNLIKIIL